MAEETQNSSGEVSDRPAGDRLESWKEIAGYLKRDVRTVQRWEKLDGLPIYRHGSGKLGGVYTYKSELDGWWVKERHRLEAATAPVVPELSEPGSRLPIGWWSAAAVAVAVGSLAGTMWIARDSLQTIRTPAAPVSFKERDWVLIAQFENRTGDPQLDGVLEYALERELANSRFVNVVPRDRITDALHLMKKPADTPIDTQVGREICLRDGGIQTLVSGRVEKVGPTLVLSAQVVDPVKGLTLASLSEEARVPERVLGAVRRLSNRLRERLGENAVSINESVQNLEKVTTPSLRALQLYTRAVMFADPLSAQQDYNVAVGLLREAVTVDPQFASGHALLAWSSRAKGNPREEWMDHARRALDLSASATERERLLIKGSYSYLSEDNRAAGTALEALLKLHPDDYWASLYLELVYERLGWTPHLAEAFGRLATLRPNHLAVNVRAAWSWRVWANDAGRAKPFVERSRSLIGPRDFSRSNAAWIRFLPAHEHWVAGDAGRAIKEVDDLVAAAASLDAPDKAALARHAALFYLSAGQAAKAEAILQTGAGTPLSIRTLISWAREDHGALTDAFRRYKAPPPPARGPGVQANPIFAMLAARDRQFAIVDEAIRSLERWAEASDSVSSAARLAIVRGSAQIARGLNEEGIRHLREGFGALRPSGEATFFAAADALADALVRQGDSAEAMRILEHASLEKSRAYPLSGSTGWLWLKVRGRLAEFYRQAGRERAAAAIEADLVKLLQYADADFPLLREIQARSAVRHAAQSAQR